MRMYADQSQAFENATLQAYLNKSTPFNVYVNHAKVNDWGQSAYLVTVPGEAIEGCNVTLLATFMPDGSIITYK